MLIMYSQLANEVRIILHEEQGNSATYEIFDADGKLVRKGNLTPKNTIHNISTKGMPEGVYHFRLQDQSIQFEKRSLFA